MTPEAAAPRCPHCGHPLRPFQLPENSGWDEQIHLACFDDECGYFRRGWTWMFDHYGVRASYRYRIDPATGNESPLPVWSKDAIKDRILDADVVAEPSQSADVSGETSVDRVPTRPETEKRPKAARRSSAARPKRTEGRADAKPPRKGTTP